MLTFISNEYNILNIMYHSFVFVFISIGSLKIGLTSQCLTIFGRDQVCLAPKLSSEWKATLFFIVSGILCLTTTCILLLFSQRRLTILKYARWFAFSASKYLLTVTIFFLLSPLPPFANSFQRFGECKT